MQSTSSYTQITFYYVNGQSESFMIHGPSDASLVEQDFQQLIRRILEKPWWIMHLSDQSVFVNIANVLKVEIKPTVDQLHGEDVFSHAQRVTALSRSYRGGE